MTSSTTPKQKITEKSLTIGIHNPKNVLRKHRGEFTRLELTET